MDLDEATTTIKAQPLIAGKLPPLWQVMETLLQNQREVSAVVTQLIADIEEVDLKYERRLPQRVQEYPGPSTEELPHTELATKDSPSDAEEPTRIRIPRSSPLDQLTTLASPVAQDFVCVTMHAPQDYRVIGMTWDGKPMTAMKVTLRCPCGASMFFDRTPALDVPENTPTSSTLVEQDKLPSVEDTELIAPSSFTWRLVNDEYLPAFKSPSGKLFRLHSPDDMRKLSNYLTLGEQLVVVREELGCRCVVDNLGVDKSACRLHAPSTTETGRMA